MSSQDRLPYLTATSLSQSVLNACHDNLTCALEFAITIETPTGFIYASDRNKYVGTTFYEALTNIPEVQRTIGDWLSGSIEFSTLTLELSNVDGRFNKYLPSGSDFGGWIGRLVEMKIGLRDVDSSFFTLFKGQVTDVGGLKRSTRSITIIARDKNDVLKDKFPKTVFGSTAYPYIENENKGLIIPVIYGDWTVNINPVSANVPAFIVNGANTLVQSGDVTMQCVIASNDLSYFDTANVYVLRGDNYFKFDASDIINISAGKNSFEIKQAGCGGVTMIEGSAFVFATGDVILVRVKGKDLGSETNNMVAIAKDILKTYGGLVDGDFHSSWATLAAKTVPAKSAIATISARVWIQESVEIINYVISMLNQVRCELYVGKDLLFHLLSMHIEDWNPTPTHTIKNWDVEKDSLKPQLDETNNFNRCNAAYCYYPDKGDNNFYTSFFKNDLAIAQAGKTIAKTIVFPNLHNVADVENQLQEILKLASNYSEMIDLVVTWRSLLIELGDMILLDVKIGSTQFSSVPCMIRSLSYSPEGVKIPIKIWSFQMFPFSTWNPSYNGVISGQNATITKE